MGKSTPKQPAAPDPVAVTAAQATANKEAAIAQANLNRIDQYTPQGSIKYTQIGTNDDGTPKYRQDQVYSPEQQALYDQQNQIAQALGGVAQSNIGRVADTQGRDFNFSGMTPQVTSVNGGPIQTGVAGAGNIQRGLDFSGLTQVPGAGNFSAAAQKAADSAYAAAASRLDPQFAQQQSDLSSRLANSGIAVGSDAYNREMENFARTRTDAYGQAQNTAYLQGLNAQQQEFGQGLAARQQGVDETNMQGAFANAAQDQQYQQNLAGAGFANQAQSQVFNQGSANAALTNAGRQQEIQEASYLRNLPLNDIAALLGTGGGVQNPSFNPVSQVGVAAPDYQGAVYANYNAANQQYLQAQQNRSAGLGGLFGLAGSLGGAAVMASDKRLKHSIKRVGTLANGLATYVFSYIGSAARHFGVMAQEVLQVRPDAVLIDANGFMSVDYRKVWQ